MERMPGRFLAGPLPKISNLRVGSTPNVVVWKNLNQSLGWASRCMKIVLREKGEAAGAPPLTLHSFKLSFQSIPLLRGEKACQRPETRNRFFTDWDGTGGLRLLC
jgi:hypothetical protein